MTDSSTQSSKVSIDLTLRDDGIEVKTKPSLRTITGDVPTMQTLCHAVSSLISHISTRIKGRGDLGKTQWRVGLDKRMTDAGLNIGSVTERTGTSILSARDPECDSNCPEGPHIRLRPTVRTEEEKSIYSYEVCSNPTLSAFSLEDPEASPAASVSHLMPILSRIIQSRITLGPISALDEDEVDKNKIDYEDEEKKGMYAVAEEVITAHLGSPDSTRGWGEIVCDNDSKQGTPSATDGKELWLKAYYQVSSDIDTEAYGGSKG